MNTIYLDLFSGISGDMFLGAMLDLGVDVHQLEHELGKLKLTGYHLHVARRQKAGIAGTKFDVHLEADHHHEHGHGHHTHDHADEHEHDHPHAHHHHHHHHPHERSHGAGGDHEHEHNRTFSEIKTLIQGSSLSSWVKEKSVAVFQRLAEAEGQVHDQPPETVHFHEVGAIDSIVDIVGACLALEFLGKPRLLASEVTEGTGWVRCAHGRFPVPAPATLQIFAARGVRLRQCEEPHELVTPTGAALLAELVEEFGAMQNLLPRKIGYGLGTRDNQTRPNVLRAVWCEGGATAYDWEMDRVAVLETNLDDVTAEILGHVMDQAFKQGALDVFHTPIHMKKNRPGVLLTILCAETDADQYAELLLRETTAFGVRRTLAERRKLRRECKLVDTPYGPVQVKIGLLNGRILHAAPEYESCRKLAEETGVSLKAVFEAASASARTEVTGNSRRA